MIRLPVDEHAREEEQRADIEERLAEPAVVIVGGGDIEYPSALHEGVEGIEHHAHDDDSQRHLRLPAHEQREYERTLEIVQLEHRRQNERRSIPLPRRACPQHAHHDEDGRFHQHPPRFVRNGRAVTPVEEITVTRFEELQGDEHARSRQGHYDKKRIVQSRIIFHPREVAALRTPVRDPQARSPKRKVKIVYKIRANRAQKRIHSPFRRDGVSKAKPKILNL